MDKPVLLIMAAGLGSRYGGLKQMDAVGNNGEWIIDFSLYDAHRAGFEDVVFIVREEILEDFKDTIGKRIANKFNMKYVVQTIDDLPEGYTVPEGREKPWGTAHAVYTARHALGDRPFLVLNADDYYGTIGFKTVFDFLSASGSDDFCMIGYQLKNTVTENGSVARGVCVTEKGKLVDIVERTNIVQFDDGIKFSLDDGETWVPLADETPVSLNCWGFSSKVLDEISREFPEFLDNEAKANPLKAEFFLPSVVEGVISKHIASVEVLNSTDKWYGVTYRKDVARISEALNDMKAKGIYPKDLWK